MYTIYIYASMSASVNALHLYIYQANNTQGIQYVYMHIGFEYGKLENGKSTCVFQFLHRINIFR